MGSVAALTPPTMQVTELAGAVPVVLAQAEVAPAALVQAGAVPAALVQAGAVPAVVAQAQVATPAEVASGARQPKLVDQPPMLPAPALRAEPLPVPVRGAMERRAGPRWTSADLAPKMAVRVVSQPAAK